MGAETMETWEIIRLLVHRQLCSSSGKKKTLQSMEKLFLLVKTKGCRARTLCADSMSAGEKKDTTNKVLGAGELQQFTMTGKRWCSWKGTIWITRWRRVRESFLWNSIVVKFSAAAVVYDETRLTILAECVWFRCAISQHPHRLRTKLSPASRPLAGQAEVGD